MKNWNTMSSNSDQTSGATTPAMSACFSFVSYEYICSQHKPHPS